MQTWETDEIPEKWKDSPKSIKLFYPNSQYYLLTSEDRRNFVIKYFPKFLDIHDNAYKPVMRADLVRCMWLYIHGGVYMDLDYKLIKPLDFLETEKGIFISRAKMYKEGYNNSFLASHKGCDFWLYCLGEIWQRYYNKPFYVFDDFKTLYITGPMMLTKVIQEYPGVINIIPYHFLTPCDYGTGKCDYRYSYRVDLVGDSWTGSFIKILRHIYSNMEYFATIFVLIIILIICLYVVNN